MLAFRWACPNGSTTGSYQEPSATSVDEGLCLQFMGLVRSRNPAAVVRKSDGSREVAARFRPLAKHHHCSPPNRMAPEVATSCAPAGTSPDGKLALGEFHFMVAQNTGLVPRPIQRGTANLPKRQVHLSVQKTNHSSHTSTVAHATPTPSPWSTRASGRRVLGLRRAAVHFGRSPRTQLPPLGCVEPIFGFLPPHGIHPIIRMDACTIFRRTRGWLPSRASVRSICHRRRP
jgi:hypothetical protein